MWGKLNSTNDHLTLPPSLSHPHLTLPSFHLPSPFHSPTMSFGKVGPNDHPIVAEGFISRGAWALVEDKFSDFAKTKLADVVRFTLVSGRWR